MNNKVTFSEGKPIATTAETTESHQSMVAGHHSSGAAQVEGLKSAGHELAGKEVTKHA